MRLVYRECAISITLLRLKTFCNPASPVDLVCRPELPTTLMKVVIGLHDDDFDDRDAIEFYTSRNNLAPSLANASTEGALSII